MRTLRAIALFLTVGCGSISVPPPPVADTAAPVKCTTDEDCAQAGKDCLTVSCDTASGTCGTAVQQPNTCYVNDVCYAPGQEQPGNRCMTCDPAADTGAFAAVTCDGTAVCDPTSGECAEAPDVVDDVDGGGDTGDADVVEPDIDEPDTDEVVEPTKCETNADCKGEVELAECEAAVCIKATGDCAAVGLPEGSACAPPEAANPECFKGICDADSACQAEPLSNVGCDDDDACTQGDVCQDGQCVGAAKDCSDGNDCTIDSCDPATADCSSEAVPDGGEAQPCEDGNPCTVEDLCDAGSCVGGANACTCQSDADCDNDEDLCNGTLVCVDQGDGTKACEIEADSVVECDTSKDDDCNETTCDPATGVCASQSTAGQNCDDGDACTFADKCSADGACLGTTQVCDDSNVCTDDTCNADGECEFADNTSPCNDGDGCTSSDTCAGGECIGTPKVCDDAKACTNDFCGDDGVCVFESQAGQPCDDGSACTIDDACMGDVCVGTSTCDDNNGCTDDSCDPATGCKNEPNVDSCSDGDACTTADTCGGGVCVGGAPPNCTAKGQCKKGLCDPVAGCVVADADDGKSCNDGNDCTKGDVCIGGACTGEPVCECQTDKDCAPATACAGPEKCAPGEGGTLACQPGEPVLCKEPLDPCKQAVCVESQGGCVIQNANEGKNCGPDNECETGLACKAGECVGAALPGPDVVCQTPVDCTPGEGCSYQPKKQGSACSDGDNCTEKDACDANGNCAAQKLDCDDDEPCTTDSCHQKLGCLHSSLIDGTECDLDDNLCTVDTCSSGVCKPFKSKFCNDGVDCTNDSCSAKTGECVFAPDDGACDDKNPCTADTCSATGCKNTAVNDFTTCSDGSLKTGPDFCFQGSCAGGIQTASDAGFALCSPFNRQSTAVMSYGASFYVVGGYDVKSLKFNPFPTPPSCVDPVLTYTQVHSLSGNGVLEQISVMQGNATDAVNGVIVGDEGLAGQILGETVEWNGDFAEAIDKAGGGSINWNTAAHATSGSFLAWTQNYLLGGRTKSSGAGLLCKVGKSWSCTQTSVSGISSSEFVPDSSTLYNTPCTKPPCLTSTLGGGWFGSNSTSGSIHFLEDPTADLKFGMTTGLASLKGSVTGAVQATVETAWHFGSYGLFYSCSDGKCVQMTTVPSQSTMHFVDGVSYAGGVILLAQRTTGGASLVFAQPAGSKTKFVVVDLPKIEVATSIAATTTAGVYVLGHDEKMTEYQIHSFLK